MANSEKQPAGTLNDCPECGNRYLAVRTDVYKDGREFVYCDCCGCTAVRAVWNRIAPDGVRVVDGSRSDA